MAEQLAEKFFMQMANLLKSVSVEALRKGKDGFEDSSSIGKTQLMIEGFIDLSVYPKANMLSRITEPSVQKKITL